jgi:hypothetical protein
MVGFNAVVPVLSTAVPASVRDLPVGFEIADGGWIAAIPVNGEDVRWTVVRVA